MVDKTFDRIPLCCINPGRYGPKYAYRSITTAIIDSAGPIARRAPITTSTIVRPPMIRSRVVSAPAFIAIRSTFRKR